MGRGCADPRIIVGVHSDRGYVQGGIVEAGEQRGPETAGADDAVAIVVDVQAYDLLATVRHGGTVPVAGLWSTGAGFAPA
jgi:hypothetical protein